MVTFRGGKDSDNRLRRCSPSISRRRLADVLSTTVAHWMFILCDPVRCPVPCTLQEENYPFSFPGPLFRYWLVSDFYVQFYTDMMYIKLS